MGSENDQQQGTDFKEGSQGRNTGPANPASQELTPEQLKVDWGFGSESVAWNLLCKFWSEAVSQMSKLFERCFQVLSWRDSLRQLAYGALKWQSKLQRLEFELGLQHRRKESF